MGQEFNELCDAWLASANVNLREDAPVNLTLEDIDKPYESWDRKKHKYLIEYVAETLKCKKQAVPFIFTRWCICKALTDRRIGEQLNEPRC